MNSIGAIAADDHVRGTVGARLTLVQYGDYDCMHTRASAAIIKAVESRLDAPVQFVFRHFPLRHMHANAQTLSEIAEASAALGKFWETHDRLMSHRDGLTRDDVMHDLAAAKVDVDAVQRLIAGTAVKARIERDVQQGARAGVHSTPTWFFNGVLWDGQYDVETLLKHDGLARITLKRACGDRLLVSAARAGGLPILTASGNTIQCESLRRDKSRFRWRFAKTSDCSPTLR
jgi:protein-disulfide isomerase